nr:PREDICTED: ring-infected erythrocyte surface antigen-like [Stegastes partitus]
MTEQLSLEVNLQSDTWQQQQQHSIDQLSESFTTMHERITNFQQVMETEDAQPETDLLVEERLFALEEAQKQAQEKAEVALTTSEELKNSDLLSQLWALHAELNTRWDEIKQAALSVTTLQGMYKNHSEEFEVIKKRVASALSFGSALSETVAGLTSACSRIAEQVTLGEDLNAQFEGQASELNDLRELLNLHNAALHTNNQEMAAIKELVKAKQAMRAQTLEETLSLVRMTLDEQFFTSQTLHGRIMAQLHTFHSQLANGPSLPITHKSTEEGRLIEKLVSRTAQNDAELQEKMEDAEDDTEEQAEEDVMQEEQPSEHREDGDVTEEQEEDEIAPEERVEEEITGQSEEAKDAGETAEDETAEENTAGYVLEESLEEEVSKDEEEPPELIGDIFVDTHEEDD